MKPIRWMQIFRSDLTAIGCGLLLTLAFPSAGLSLLAWGAMAPMFLVWQDRQPAQCFRSGMVVGIAHYLSLVYWLVHTMGSYGGMPVMASVPVLFLLAAYGGIYFGVFAVIAGRMSPKRMLTLVVLPTCWVGLEYLRSFLFTGIPWGLLGYSQYRFVHLIQIADVAGVYALSFLVMMGNAAIWMIVCPWQTEASPTRRMHFRIGVAGLMAIGVMATLWYGHQRMAQIDLLADQAPKVRVGVVQANIDQAIKWDKAFIHLTVDKYRALVQSLAVHKPQLVVWPETATPFYFGRHPKWTPPVLDAARENGVDLLIGSPAVRKVGGRKHYHNSAFLVDQDGIIQSRYDKTHLVPFGEYVPFGQWLPIEKLVAGIGDFSPGEKGKTTDWLPAVPLGIQICYEIIFPPLSRMLTEQGAGLLVNITNDAWYGRTSAPYQHFSMTVFRAIENRRSLVRAANTGISGFVHPSGRILSATPIYVEAADQRLLPVLSERSVYARWGDWFARICLVIAVGSPAVLFLRKRKPGGIVF